MGKGGTFCCFAFLVYNFIFREEKNKTVNQKWTK